MSLGAGLQRRWAVHPATKARPAQTRNGRAASWRPSKIMSPSSGSGRCPETSAGCCGRGHQRDDSGPGTASAPSS